MILCVCVCVCVCELPEADADGTERRREKIGLEWEKRGKVGVYTEWTRFYYSVKLTY